MSFSHTQVLQSEAASRKTWQKKWFRRVLQNYHTCYNTFHWGVEHHSLFNCIRMVVICLDGAVHFSVFSVWLVAHAKLSSHYAEWASSLPGEPFGLAEERGRKRHFVSFSTLWLHRGRRPALPLACYIWCITPWGALVNIWTSKHRWLNAWLPWVNRWHSSRSPIFVLPGSLNLWQTKHKVLSCIIALQVATGW